MSEPDSTRRGSGGAPAGQLVDFNRLWPFSGGDVRDIGAHGSYVVERMFPAGPDEVIARVDAVCVCSSDIKIIRMGADHPLFSQRDLGRAPVVLGHEIALTVVDVGENWRSRYHAGQRLGLQPAIIKDGRRLTVGVDIPGGLGQFIRLDDSLLGRSRPAYVFDVPDNISAANIALLEPYACVEAAFRKNSRTTLKPGGRLLVIGGPDGEKASLSLEMPIGRAVLVNAPPGIAAWARRTAATVAELQTAPDGEEFDDIIACGFHTSRDVASLLRRLARGGLLVLAAKAPDPEPVPVDAARIHYHEIAILGTTDNRVETAFGDSRNRFALKSRGVALVLGAGGAMGRIHIHRALELPHGPAKVIATSRRGSRLDALKRDFCPLAEQHGRELVVIEDSVLETAAATHAPGGFDDAVVIAPEVKAIGRAALLLAPDGMLVIFAGTAFGEPCPLPLARVATHGLRITGSTGCTVEDQLGVLARVVSGELDPSDNLEAIAGFNSVPEALDAVTEGRLSGKIAIYPNLLNLPLTPIQRIKPGPPGYRHRWTREDEQAIGAGAGE